MFITNKKKIEIIASGLTDTRDQPKKKALTNKTIIKYGKVSN